METNDISSTISKGNFHIQSLYKRLYLGNTGSRMVEN